MSEAFTWRDGERLIRFGTGVVEEAPTLLEREGFGEYALLTTPRAASEAPAVVAGAAAVVEVPAGRVDELSARLLGQAGGPVVALGGGRVTDVAKAIAGATGQRAAAIPTTLAGAEMTPFHRLPGGVNGARMIRPALVVADPALMASQPQPGLTASAMNALAHAMEALYTPLANPVAELSALCAATLLSAGVNGEGATDLALGALLAGHASGLAGIAVHHALCQSIVRGAGTPHAATNAVMLPHSARLMTDRAPEAMGALAGALGDRASNPAAAPGLLVILVAHAGEDRLGALGVEKDQLPSIAGATAAHPALANTPDPPGPDELLSVLAAAL